MGGGGGGGEGSGLCCWSQSYVPFVTLIILLR